jgi:hypothetical protein
MDAVPTGGRSWLHAAITYGVLTLLIFRFGILRQTLTGLQVPAADPANPGNPRTVVMV